MPKLFLLFTFIISSCLLQAQKVLVSWGQNTIENYSKDMYDEAQKLSAAELLKKNLADNSWSAVFLTMNASVNNYSKDTAYLKGLAAQVDNTTETKLQGTSRLIIWERISSGDIVFEGKGLVMENDLFIAGARANQLLQMLTKHNFGIVSSHTTRDELNTIKNKWLDFLSGKTVEEYKPAEYKNAKIRELCSPAAVEALVFSLQPNPKKDKVTRLCLKKVYQLNEMPKDKDSPANFCNPDTYTYSYLAMLFGNIPGSETRDAAWWKKFWDTNHDKLVWNEEKGMYAVKE